MVKGPNGKQDEGLKIAAAPTGNKKQEDDNGHKRTNDGSFKPVVSGNSAAVQYSSSVRSGWAVAGGDLLYRRTSPPRNVLCYCMEICSETVAAVMSACPYGVLSRTQRCCR